MIFIFSFPHDKFILIRVVVSKETRKSFLGVYIPTKDPVEQTAILVHWALSEKRAASVTLKIRTTPLKLPLTMTATSVKETHDIFRESPSGATCSPSSSAENPLNHLVRLAGLQLRAVYSFIPGH